MSLMATSPGQQQILILGSGVIGLTTSLVLCHAYPGTKITIVAKHFPGDRSIEYTSPWAGANWSSMAHDNGPLERFDEITFKRFGELIDGKSVFGCQSSRAGEIESVDGVNGGGNENGIGRMGMWGVFDAPIEETGILTEETGKVWYDQLVGGLRTLEESELPKNAVFGFEFPQTYRINTQVYLQWLQSQALSKGVKLVRRHYPAVSAVLSDHPFTTLLINCTGLGSLSLSDIRDTKLYPTRGQTLLVAEPKKPITRMYEFDRSKYDNVLFETAFFFDIAMNMNFLLTTQNRYFRSPRRIDPSTTYVFPRPLGGGVILGGSRQDNDWSDEWDEELGQDIMNRCCELCPDLGRPEDLQVIARNLRVSVAQGSRLKRGSGMFLLCIAMGMLELGINHRARFAKPHVQNREGSDDIAMQTALTTSATEDFPQAIQEHPNALKAAKMSTPQAKRRRLNEATKTLQKPFKSPFRTPLKPGIGDDPPSSDPHEIHASVQKTPKTALVTTRNIASSGNGQHQSASAAVSGQVPGTPVASKPRISKPLVSRPNISTLSRVASKKTPSKPSLTREMMQLRNEIQMLTQAQTLATSTKDDDLVVLVDKWRTASRAAAEELFGSTRDRVNRMGGVGAWKEREKESKERQLKWDQEEMEAEREKMEEAKENGEVSEETYDRYADMDGEREKVEEEKETFKGADDDSFTMDLMLKTLNIDLKLIGYSKEAQRWDG
ncbi:FAD dependent oxidoreductase [Pyrenophora seminiperda CCB06]|uniref:FAD dependent oxidoreductase n=1 Tax=Pyrenophora seminiperda CCB06 TaxID=1302712 RepID=A0A3M7LYV2_9PLEO|nr:FAD dependent oxidoreductase [Pyrenophora seminiperda CCB06]